jgi:hypothetical protein
VTVPPLEEYERRHRHQKIISVDFKSEPAQDLPGTSAEGELQPQAMP